MTLAHHFEAAIGWGNKMGDFVCHNQMGFKR
jgi:hypothetical protein